MAPQIPLVVVTTATGQAIECPLCDFTEQIAIGTPVSGVRAILQDHADVRHSVTTEEYYGAALLRGAGPPTTSLGTLGNYYLDTSTWLIYGPKTVNGWGTGTPLIFDGFEGGAP